MTPAAGATCRYITDWVVKTHWGLSVAPAAHDAIQRITAGCDNPVVPVARAR
ncbi:hypothetical protein [Kitasatospora griseola]|uniref:hypothetical protein n=1 Tax=Kitasatospora griseola TaxID=2064 RepID=UPI003660E7BC